MNKRRTLIQQAMSKIYHTAAAEISARSRGDDGAMCADIRLLAHCAKWSILALQPLSGAAQYAATLAHSKRLIADLENRVAAMSAPPIPTGRTRQQDLQFRD